MRAPGEPELPESVVELLDGTELHDKLGHTILLVVCEPTAWPRLALLSVGEVVASSSTAVYLALYGHSETTRALTRTGKALLTLVLDGAVYKLRLATERVGAGSGGNAYFHGRVTAVEQDTVSYARVLHGIEYQLLDESRVLARWQRQVGELRRVAAR